MTSQRPRSTASASTGQDLDKQREIVFHATPPGQPQRALALLAGQAGVTVEAGPDPQGITVCYRLTENTLKSLETLLETQGFHLETTLYHKLVRALIHYCEEVQLDNLSAPEKRLKRPADEAYVHAWEQREHGDHDDRPAEWREYH